MTDMPHYYFDNQLMWAKWWFPEHPHDRGPRALYVAGHIHMSAYMRYWTYVVLPSVEYDDYGSILPWSEE